MKQNICANPNCKLFFTPGRRHPNQKYCTRPECRRYRNSLRGKRHYARHCSDETWYRPMLDRKREERRRRGANRPSRPHAGRGGPAVGAASFYPMVVLQLLTGMAAMLTGSRDASEVRSAVGRCLDHGRELFDFEAAQKTSLDELFLTLVRADNGAAPNAGSFSTG